MENSKVKANHDISIALIQKDIEYIKNNVTGINAQLQMMDKNYARHEDLSVIVKMCEGLKKDIESKVNLSDFEPFKTALNRVNWLIISAIVLGLISLVVNKI